MSHLEVIPQRTQNSLEVLYILFGRGTPWNPTGGPREFYWGEECLSFSTEPLVSMK